MSKGFRIAARALRQLGAELITTDEMALNELIKNAFDAKSKRILIKVSYPFNISGNELLKKSKDWSDDKSTYESDLRAFIVPEISASLCDEIINYFINYESNAYDSVKAILRKYNFIKVKDFGCGMTADDLRDAFLVVGTPVKWLAKKNGEEELLLGEKGVGRLSMMKLGQRAKVVSGIEGVGFYSKVLFDWNKFDDPNEYLDNIEIPVYEDYKEKEKAESGTEITIYDLYAHWGIEKITDFVNSYLRRLQDQFDNKKPRFPVEIQFNGKGLEIERMPVWLKNSANFQSKITLNPNKKKMGDIVYVQEFKWYGESTPTIKEINLKDLLHRLECSHQDLIDVGQLDINCLWFNRSDWRKTSHDKSYNEFKKELNIWCGGFAIYRDSFRVGVTGSQENDWLKMDSKSLMSQGFAFNRYQTVGSISISQEKNPNFIDAANREHLIESAPLQLLKRLMMDVVIKDLKSNIAIIKEKEFKGTIAKVTAENVVTESISQLDKADKSIKVLAKIIPDEHVAEIKEIRSVLKFQRENVRQFANAVKLATEQRVEILELASIGMVVEKVVHELARLTSMTADNLKRLERGGFAPGEAASIIKVIKEQMKVTNKRIKSIDTLSPSARNTKDKFNLRGLIETVFAGYQGRFERHNIEARILINGLEKDDDITVNMVTGLVAQILENLLSNSLYWLQVSVVDSDRQRKIFVDIDTKSRTILFYDNGPGVDPAYAEEIFKPYYTTRPKGKGLGLFIARELASYHQAKLYLDLNQDEDGRLRCFILELPAE